MAFGRKKREEQQAGEVADLGDAPVAQEDQGSPVHTDVHEAAPAEPGAESLYAPPAGGEPMEGGHAAPGDELTEGGFAPGGEPSEGGHAAPGDELTEATAGAGDDAAAGVDSHGPGADLHDGGSAREVAAATGAPSAGTADPPTGPESVGSIASSPDPAVAPASYGAATDGSHEGYAGGDGGGEGEGVADKAGAAAAGAQTLVESRPEVLVGAAFVGGLVLARVLGAIGSRG